METNDEGEITMKIVVEHIKGLEAGSGNNVWVGADRVGEMTPRLTAGQPEAGVPDEREEAGGARRAGRVPGQDD